MKNVITGHLFAALLLLTAALSAQPVAKTDALALLTEIPAAPATLEGAYQRAYAAGATSPDAAAFYTAYMSKVEAAYRENQMLQQQFYTKYPTGIRPQQQTASKASPQQEAAMNSATAELAQKMMSDPAFAQKFSQMSEKEQHAYIAQLLADKGLKPASGTPNTNMAPIPGTDVEWATLCTDYSQSAMSTSMSRLEALTALQQKYEARHQEVRDWTEAEIKKLPMISFGEYGHDHDPEKVKAIRKQGLAKHREVAQAKLTEATGLFKKHRQEAAQRVTPLNSALKGVSYGSNYDFGVHYTTVIGAQAMMFAEPDALVKDEVSAINEAAQWEYDWRNFK